MDYGCVKNGIGKMNRSILLSPEKLTKLGGKLYPHIVPEQTIIGSVSFLVAGMSVYVRTCQSLLYIRRTGMGSVYCVYMILYMGGGRCGHCLYAVLDDHMIYISHLRQNCILKAILSVSIIEPAKVSPSEDSISRVCKI